MGFDLPVTYRLPALAALLCLAVSGCAATTSGTAMPAERAPLTTADALPALLLSAGDVGAALVVEFDGPRAGLGEDADRARAICEAEGAREVRRARDDEERIRFWHARKKAFGAMGRLAPDLLVQDATVPRSRLPEVLTRIIAIARLHDLRVCNYFHAGDGNLHPNLLFDRRDADMVRRVELASKEIMKACVDAGGTITGEHGVGIDKKEYMRLIFGDEELRAMWGVKRVFDPELRANPGKVLPEVSP